MSEGDVRRGAASVSGRALVERGCGPGGVRAHAAEGMEIIVLQDVLPCCRTCYLVAATKRVAGREELDAGRMALLLLRKVASTALFS